MPSVIAHRHKSSPLAAGAVLFTLRDKPAADGGEEQAPDGAEG
jgi:hypothetical protein